MSSEERYRPGALVWLDLTVEDADTIRDFYRDVVGWTVEGLDMGGYEDWVLSDPNSGMPVAGVCSARGANVGLPAVWLAYVAVADLDIALARCEERGGTVLHRRGEPGSGRLAIVRDPADAVIGLVERAANHDRRRAEGVDRPRDDSGL
jgi:hypothetical protein